MKSIGHLAGCVTLADQLEDLKLAIRERFEREPGLCLMPDRPGDQAPRGIFAQIDLAISHRPDGIENAAGCVVLVDVAESSRPKRALCVKRIGVHRAYQHLDRAVALLDPLDQVDTITFLERDIDHDHVG